MLSESSNPEEFLEHTKLELFHDQVFCFTPKGKLIALPRKANVIDFAYAVHTDVGNSGVAARSTASSRRCRPIAEWRRGRDPDLAGAVGAALCLGIACGHRQGPRRDPPRDARAVRGQYAGLGRRIVERLFQRAKMEYSDEKLKGALPRLARASIEDVMAAVGRGEMEASDVARAMYPDYKEERVARARHPNRRAWSA